MNKKKLFSNLTGTGVRLTILTSMVMMALVGTILPAAAAPSPSPQAVAVSIDLYAVAGETYLPGLATPVTIWGYTLGGAGTITKPGGPMIEVNQGDEVTITLHNTLGEPTALLFQGQSMIPDLVGVNSGENNSGTPYTFTANKAGTFLYEAGLLPNAQHQVAMGLYGALIVRPTGYDANAPTAYGAAYQEEQVLVLSELDTTLNNSANPAAFDIRNYSPKYYLINGVAYPDTANIIAATGDTVLLRYVNAGLQAHSMSTLGVSQSIIANDGNAYQYPHSVVAESIPTGQTMDTLVTVSGVTGTQYPLYDASLFLRNNNGSGLFAGLGGMMTMIEIGTPTTPPPPTPTSDTTGPVASALGLSPNPADGTVNVILTASISDVTTGNSNIAAAEYFIDDTSAGDGFGLPMDAVDGAYNIPIESVSVTVNLTGLADGDHTIYVHGQDSALNWGSFETITLTLRTDTVGPVASALDISPNPSDRSGDVTVTATIDDTTTGGSIIDAAEFYVDTTAGSPYSMDPIGPFAFDTATGNVTGTIPQVLLKILAAGDHTIYVRGHDTSGNWGSFETIVITIVDSLRFSTSGNSLSGPAGIGASNFGDIYLWDGGFSTSIPASVAANIDGFSWVDDTHYYVSFASDVPSLGVADEDVVYYNNGVWELYFDGSANGLGASNIDAISVTGGILYFSTSDATVPTGLTGPGDDADIYSWNGSTFKREFDATAEGWSGNNVDGLLVVSITNASTADFYLSYSPTSTPVAGLGIVQDEDVVHYKDGVWSIYFDGTAEGLTSFSLDVDAFNAP